MQSSRAALLAQQKGGTVDVDLSSLLVLRHLAETGSFTDAGRRWNLSQPAVSLMISRLESAAGLVLLERSPNRTRLTPDGTAFLQCAGGVCDAYLSFIDGLNSLARREDHHVLTGLDNSWFSACLREDIAALRPASGAQPVMAELTECWSRDLELGRYDVVVAGRFLRSCLTEGLQEAVIRKERGITVAWNPDFYPFDPGNFSFPDVLRTSVLFPGKAVIAGFTSFLLRWCEEAYGVEPASVIEFPSEREAAMAARGGLGVLMAPGDVMPRLAEIGAGMTHVRTFEFLLPEAFTYGVYCRRDEDSREVLSAAAAIARLGVKAFA